MKRYRNLALLCVAVYTFGSCSSDEHTPAGDPLSGDAVEVKALSAPLGQMVGENLIQPKAVEDFAVNTPLDPTSVMQERTDWYLDFQIYKGSTTYPDGVGNFEWDNTTQLWVPRSVSQITYFPNYLKQNVSATLYPQTWNGVVALNQASSDLLLEQDILTQNGAQTVTVNPAHIPTIPLRHGNSMLDFIIDKADESQIKSIKVYVGTDEYTPYRVATADKIEYLVILPLGIQKPVVSLTTNEGAMYSERIEITNTQVNVCYCVHMLGVELTLSTITIADWMYGEALSGEYSTSTSYPTFQGPPEETCTLYFQNGQSQTITFNTNGERTIKPVGRMIVKIEKSDGNSIDTHIALSGMIIDLTPYLVP